MNMRGGHREGAGRKQGFSGKNAEEARRMLSERVAQEIGPIGDALILKAKNGDIPAIKELFDRAWGRSPQSIALGNVEPIVMNIVNYAATGFSEKNLRTD